ncbi:MAG TPA: Asp23/Gls24 family envelope stress response protein, partial [Firmicutes bacterium]|nr:Asp23/Gls24 family envelope stress response protein [Bacillota bacterium]
EVKKGFSGYLVDPLRFLFRPRQAPEPAQLMVEKSVVRPTYSSLGKFLISQSVVTAIAARASREVEGVERVLRARVDIKQEGVAVSLDLALKYGPGLVYIMPTVQERVAERLEHMTALNVLSVNVAARKLVFE